MVSRLPYRLSQHGDDGVSQVPGGPSIACPASTTPVDPPIPGRFSTRDLAFPLHVQSRRPQRVISELFTQPTISLSALHRFGYPHGARLASGWWPPQGLTGLDPQDLFGKFPSDSSHVISSPFPELCSAHTTLSILSIVAFRLRFGRHLQHSSNCVSLVADHCYVCEGWHHSRVAPFLVVHWVLQNRIG